MPVNTTTCAFFVSIQSIKLSTKLSVVKFLVCQKTIYGSLPSQPVMVE